MLFLQQVMLFREGVRPGELITLDTRFNLLRASRLIFGHLFNQMPPGEPLWAMDDIAVDADNDWDDPAVVGAHVYSGWTYDYFSHRHGWEGIDGSNGRTISMVNIDVYNAFFVPPPFGPEGRGVFGFGRAIDETSEVPLTVLDIVGHELMHGVTHFSVSNRTGSPLGLFNPFPLDARRMALIRLWYPLALVFQPAHNIGIQAGPPPALYERSLRPVRECRSS